MSFETIWHGNLSRIVALGDRAFLRLGNLPVRDQCNVGILLASGGIVLIDYPEQHPDDEILREVETLFHKKVTHIVFTHAHGDHRNGLSSLTRNDIVLMASPAGAAEIRACCPELQNPVRILEDREQFRIGDLRFSIQIPRRLPAHSPWDMLIGCETENLLFTGDFLNPPDTLYFHSSNYLNWQAEMEVLLCQKQWKYLILGHGLPWTVKNGRLSLDYLSALGKLFEALQQKGFVVTEKTDYPQLCRQLPELKEELTFLTETAGSAHVLRQLKEIQHSLA